MPEQRLYTFLGGAEGAWKIDQITAPKGDNIRSAAYLKIQHAAEDIPDNTSWTFRGITSNERYVDAGEKSQLISRQEGLGRPESNLAAMILIRKNASWWRLSQSERREILETQSAHIRIGMKHLPQIARKLHHCRDLGETEPFDFITWFEFAPRDAADFDALVRELRATPEWNFVEREIDIRLKRTFAR